MKDELVKAIEEAKEAYDENMGFIRCIKSDPRNIIHDAYEHALTLAIAEIEEKDKYDQATDMYEEYLYDQVEGWKNQLEYHIDRITSLEEENKQLKEKL